MGTFEINKDRAGEFRFNLMAGNGEIILRSEGYTTKANCKNGIEAVKVNAPFDYQFERKDEDQNYRFNLKSTNGQIIGVSESYKSLAGREKGIESVKANAPEAMVLDNA